MSNLIINRLVVAYPSGNTTAIVFDSIEELDREQLNRRILAAWQAQRPDKPQIEQCCFVTKPSNPLALGRLQMFGGEFCGNATRGVVWLLTDGKESSGLIEASGCSKPLRYTVKNGIVALEMPQTEITQTEWGLTIKFEGITQVITPAEDTRNLLEQLVGDETLNWNKLPAVGVTNYNPTTKQARFSVWVKDVNTIFDETACGSGSAAIGIALASQAKQNQSLVITQPSGEPITVNVELTPEGNIQTTEISGAVEILYDGEMGLLFNAL